MTGEGGADDRILEDVGLPETDGFPDVSNAICLSSRITMPAPRQPHERDEAHEPALPPQDLRVGVAAWSKNEIVISSWPNSRMTTKLPAVLGA